MDKRPSVAPSHPGVLSGGRSRTGRLVAWCARRAWWVASAGVLLGTIACLYAATHFAMTTDTNQLLSRNLIWRRREIAFDQAFPTATAQIVAVIDAKTPELAEEGAAALTQRLAGRPDLFHLVRRPDAGPFWSQNGLLYAPAADVRSDMDQLIKAQPFLGPLAADPSLRGLMTALSTTLQGVATGAASLEQLRPPIARLADTLESLKAGQPTFFSWRTLISGRAPDPRELRRLILIDPSLDFGKLVPGMAATTQIRQDAAALGLDAAHGVSVRLTGATPLQDEDLATLADRVVLIAGLALGAIILMLWMAVRSARLIGAILTTTLTGLAITAALGLLAFHRFNVISVAFIPLFVGLGIDFGIQFSVRFRSELAGHVGVREALVASGRGMGRSLTLAASAIACGFLAFAPTNYYGVSQLGMVAGVGMFVALALNLTLLPALIQILKPTGAPEGPSPKILDKIDDFVLGHRRLVLGSALGAAAACAALLPLVHFDFNPMHMRSPKTESVATLFDLMKDPDQSPNTVEAILPDLASADRLAAKVAGLPEVHATRTLSSFVPSDQPAKIAAISDASTLLGLTLDPLVVSPPPSDAETVQALNQTSADLTKAAGTAAGPAATDARRLASDLAWLASAGPAARARANQTLIPGLDTVLGQIRDSLAPQPITLASLPPDLTRDWVAPDGRARLSVLPSGNSNDNKVLMRFTNAVKKVIPDASGPAIGIQAGGRVVVDAFFEAGVLSFVAITILLLIVLRRVRDVAITMAPIILTGLLTLGSCVVIGRPLNFANIIALPLLFGIGVAFHIYFVMSWRSGGSHLLTSSLARAVFFSALTTATGFGSLWASKHPGTASMGELLMISLLWTLVSALLFQPALMGPPPAKPDPVEGS